MARKSKIQEVIAAAKRGDPELYQPVEIEGPIRLTPVKTHLMAIQSYDPINFLGHIMQGKMVKVKMGKVKDGEIQVTEYEVTPSIGDRIEAAKFLANKLIPTMHAHKIMSPDDPNEVSGDKNSLEVLVERAIVKAAQSH